MLKASIDCSMQTQTRVCLRFQTEIAYLCNC